MLYILSLLLMGFFYLGITPIFEGFDEFSHYSAVRQIAYQGGVPTRHESYIDQNLLEYDGPLPYSSGIPPYDRGLTYNKFSNNSDLISNYINKYVNNPFRKSYSPSHVENSEYRQNPPLYYFIMGSVLGIFKNLSLSEEIFSLRAISFLFVIAGISLALYATFKFDIAEINKLYILWGFILYPFIFPMFYPEFLRVGNDSLCFLLISVIYFLILRINKQFNNKNCIILGSITGLGLLTKAFFLPVLAALIIYITLNTINFKFLDTYKKVIIRLILFIIPAILVGGWWYIYSYINYGTITGANIAIEALHQNINTANAYSLINIFRFFRGLAVIPITFIWGGTYSLVHLPYLWYLPIILVMMVLFTLYIISILTIKVKSFLYLPLWILSFFMIGLTWHAWINLTINGGNSNTPGWYLHVLMPFTCIVLAIVLERLLKIPYFKNIILFFWIYCIVFQLTILWFQITLYSGCSIKDIDKTYFFNTSYVCLSSFYSLLNSINIFGSLNLVYIGSIGWLTANFCLIISFKYQQFDNKI